jgi:hypothetical protein
LLPVARILAPMIRPPLAATLLLGLLAAACAPGRAGEAPPVVAQPVALHTERDEVREVGRLEYLAGFALAARDPRFGGLSALWLEPDGASLLAASDRGTLWAARLDHAADGTLIGFAGWQALAPGRRPGDPTHPRDQDAEAIAVDRDGRLIIAYEGTHRLRRFPADDPTAVPEALPLPGALARRSNTGIEALADLADGRLLALSEGMPDGRGDISGWIIDDDGALEVSWARTGGFVPTGADRLDDVIYVVERRFSVLGGFAARIVRLATADVVPGARLEGEELALLRSPLLVDNFEGIAARRGADGRTLLYLVSDDNFTVLQRTLLLQFALIEE